MKLQFTFLAPANKWAFCFILFYFVSPLITNNTILNIVLYSNKKMSIFYFAYKLDFTREIFLSS